MNRKNFALLSLLQVLWACSEHSGRVNLFTEVALPVSVECGQPFLAGTTQVELPIRSPQTTGTAFQGRASGMNDKFLLSWGDGSCHLVISELGSDWYLRKPESAPIGSPSMPYGAQILKRHDEFYSDCNDNRSAHPNSTFPLSLLFEETSYCGRVWRANYIPLSVIDHETTYRIIAIEDTFFVWVAVE
ncbi:hypothetical protein Q4555_00605 [Octadecabacter sp. 1_MG-2023]|uniref:hypothetical protein n=1 Tax=unclassified Octadecabacter TaxID=196158 RepID=UPI001C098857|nr:MULTISPECIES: hypothetical protein [unclassified Octadecabacter]MBU2993396.1 hypothetical protein [Octadecabacter sp. B2R22]MDO6733148.1 hypothetical protein [Octadecabacter sp. 1_MG-2023]